MTGSQNGQILGAATAIGGFATLPYTAGNQLAHFLNQLVIASSLFVLFSFIVTRLLAKILGK